MPDPTFTAAPAVVPSRAVPSTFSALTDPFLVWEKTFRNELSSSVSWFALQVIDAGQAVTDATAQVALAVEQVGLAEDQVALAAAQVDLADAQRVLADAAAAAAVITANAAAWVSEASYSAGANAISGVDFGTYRAILTHTGVATDPSADATNWVLISAPEKASQVEAEAGTDNDKFVTPLRAAQAIAALVPIASQAEAEAGTDNTKFLTPLRTAQAIAALAQSFAIGDTLTSARALASPEWLPSDGAVYLQSSYPALFALLGFIIDYDSATKLANPATLPPNGGNGVAFSPDGVYLSVAHNTYPFVTIYKRSGDVFTKLTNPATLPTNTGLGTAFSPDGTYLSVAHSVSPFVTIYKRSGDVFTKLDNPATLPTGHGNGTAFSPDGTYLSVSHWTSPFVTIYKRSGDVFTKLTNPATLPTGNGLGTAFSPDGVYLSVAHDTSPFVTIYSSANYDTTTQFKVTTSPEVNSPLNTFIKAT